MGDEEGLVWYESDDEHSLEWPVDMLEIELFDASEDVNLAR